MIFLPNRSRFCAILLISGVNLAGAAETLVLPGEGPDKLVEALILAQPGDTLRLGEGHFDLSDGLSLDTDNVRVVGAGPDRTILSFKNQTGAGEGLLVTSDRVVLEDFAIEDTRGDGVKAKGSDQITFRNLRVEWTNGPDEKNGAYGIYPVSSETC